MTCKECGRESGHHLGCPAVAATKENHRLQNLTDEELKAESESEETDDNEPEDDEAAAETSTCAFPGCTNPRWSTDKRVKYCEDHKVAKNRKE